MKTKMTAEEKINQLKEWGKEKIDYSDFQQLAKDCWLFLTNNKMPERKLITKEVFIEEVSTMIETAVLFNTKTESPSSDGWIAVKDGNIEKDKWYLLYNGYWTGVGKHKPPEDPEDGEPEWQDETSEYIEPYPTHFMTLPSPPNQSQG